MQPTHIVVAVAAVAASARNVILPASVLDELKSARPPNLTPDNRTTFINAISTATVEAVQTTTADADGGTASRERHHPGGPLDTALDRILEKLEKMFAREKRQQDRASMQRQREPPSSKTMPRPPIVVPGVMPASVVTESGEGFAAAQTQAVKEMQAFALGRTSGRPTTSTHAPMSTKWNRPSPTPAVV